MSTLYAIKGEIINSQEPLPIPVDILTLLWENPNPGASFAAQDITLASDDYDFLLLICRFSLTYDRELSFIVEKGKNEFINTGSTGSGGAIGIWRDFNRVNDTKYSVSNAYYAMGATAQTNNDTNLIPQRIYGFKKQVPMQSGGGGTKYDPETDMVYLWDGTQWVEWKSAGIKTPIPLIPEMTSNTSPKGSVSHTWGGTQAAYCTYKNGTRELLNVDDTTFTPYCYYLFKGSNYGMNIGLTTSGAQAFSVTYEFSEPVSVINKVKIGAGSKIAFNSGYGNAGGVLTVKALDSNGVWNDIYVRTYAPTAAHIDMEETLDIDSAYAKNVYGIKYDFTNLTGWGLYLYDLQAYGH